MAELPPVPSERVLQVLCADPLGKALWQAAYHQVLAEVLAERVEQLEQRREASGG